jgi:cytochrome c2
MQEMPGTRMAFVGIKNDKDIADLWAYLQQFGPEGQKKCGMRWAVLSRRLAR